MLRNIKNYIDVIIINLLALIIGIGLYFLTDDKIEILGAIVVTGISLSLGIRQYRTENDKIFKELFYEFNEKYDLRFNDRLQKITNAETHSLSDEDKKLLFDYFNLCAEEYLWKTKNRIPENVWISWENGMVYYFNQPAINDLLLKERGQKDSYYGLFDKIGKRINNWS